MNNTTYAWKDIRVFLNGKELTGVNAIEYVDEHNILSNKPVKASDTQKAVLKNLILHQLKKTLIIIIILATAALSSRAQTVQALADSSFAHHQYSQAFDYYAQVVKADGTNIKALRRMGFCFMNFQGQELNATRYFNQALKIQPTDPISNYYMGVIFMDEAKKQTDASAKGDFKAKAALYLNKASSYGSKEAEGAIRDLNTI